MREYRRSGQSVGVAINSRASSALVLIQPGSNPWMYTEKTPTNYFPCIRCHPRVQRARRRGIKGCAWWMIRADPNWQESDWLEFGRRISASNHNQHGDWGSKRGCGHVSRKQVCPNGRSSSEAKFRTGSRVIKDMFVFLHIAVASFAPSLSRPIRRF